MLRDLAQIGFSFIGSFLGIAVFEHWHLEDLWAARKRRVKAKRIARKTRP